MQLQQCNDDGFGPVVRGCGRDFDFTLLFENTILSILPSALVLVVALGRTWHLYRQKKLISARMLQVVKLLTLAIYTGLQAAVLGVWSTQRHAPWSSSSIAAAGLSLSSAIALCVLSYLEHGRNVRPSSVLLLYLLFSALFDAVRARTSWLLSPGSALAGISIASVVSKAVVLVMELHEKSDYIVAPAEAYGPESTSSVLNRSIFFWLNPLVWNGSRTVLRPGNLDGLTPEMTSTSLGPRFLDAWAGASERRQSYATMRAILTTLWWPILGTLVPRILLLAFTICQPVLLQALIRYLGEPSTPESESIGKGLIGAYALVYIGIAVTTGAYWYHHYRVLIMIRGCLVSAVSWQTLKVNTHALADQKSAVTLMSTDVERIIFGLRSFHEFWAIVIQVGVLAYFLQRQLGVALVVPIVVTVLSAVASVAVSRSSHARQTAWMEASQSRIGATSNILSSIKAIKMRGLTDVVSSIIQQLRVKELELAAKFRILLVWTVGLGYIPQFLSPVLTFLVFVLQARATHLVFDAPRAFTSLSLLLLIAQSLSQTLLDLPQLVAAFGSSSRIDEFLSAQHQRDFREFDQLSEKAVALSRFDKVPKSTDTAKVNPLKERVPEPASVGDKDKDIIRINHGYYGWGTIDVLQDINIAIPRGQLTLVVGPVACGKTTLCHALVGETPTAKGRLQVLGDSKQIAFCSQTPYLVNGSIRDNIVGFSNFTQPWYDTVIAACALSQDIGKMPSRDNTVVGSDGINLSGGQRQKVALARALYARIPMIVLDDILSGLDSKGANHVFWNVMGPEGVARQHNVTIIFATHAIEFLPFCDHIVALDSSGRVAHEGDYQSLRSQEGFSMYVSTAQDRGIKNADGQSGGDAEASHDAAAEPSTIDEVIQNNMGGDFTVYSYYIMAVGNWVSSILLLLVVLYAAAYNVPSYWINIWSSAADPGNLKYWGVYSALQLLALLLLFAAAYHLFIVIINRAGSSLHAHLLKAVMEAPLSFFSSTDVGVTINRFSQDLQLVDNELSLSMLTLLLTVFLSLGQVILIIVSSPWVGVAFIIIIPVFYALQNFYLRTSRQLRSLELEAKSPLYTSFLETLSGLSTLRSFGWASETLDKNLKLLDSSQEPLYLLYMIQRWLTFVLDTIVALIAIIVVALSVALKSSGGLAGVALTQVMSLSMMLTTIVLQWTIVETSIGSVGRIKAFVESTPSENKDGEDLEPPPAWPTKGSIQLDNVSAFYETNPDSLVLKNISITVEGGQKMGICGRSGSGKSSLLLLLSRMLEMKEGSIIIDDLDISTLPRKTLRARLNIVPQEPVFVTGTVRLNLDPSGEFSDTEILDALKRVHLLDVMDAKGGLAAEMDSGILSHGQRQLFCLAGAILRRANIVLLDEITSNVDQATDAIMQTIVREQFRDCTVIAIAHRLSTIANFDQVVVLDHVVVREVGNPQQLLREDSRFKEMWVENEAL
ncbi:hypothetical protein PFICI_11787 [Pestalotiopsis fici W106-1]|uniref:Uncharacterized protein n=1 Tax=Pestalotiopsis fici (strain W106-1 / CGMCC3.15140) TaxID=1229662 RepID=W3WRA6_PESFW|nr:uncharacterized protein PFICI_11787 [Pestalotiopsis fici W106-1]ETS76400.1 hypothetical protein PFICI_11787 [Pestalotiopsis fici W106-1]